MILLLLLLKTNNLGIRIKFQWIEIIWGWYIISTYFS
jgi:hypothetical protein